MRQHWRYPFSRCGMSLMGVVFATALFGGVTLAPAAATFRLEIQNASSAAWVDVAGFDHAISSSALGPTHGDVRIRKRMDKSSPLMMHDLCTGTIIPLVRLETWDTSAGRVRYYAMRLRNVLVTEHAVQLKSPANDPVEQVSFNYQKIEWTYMETDAKGQSASSSSTTWDSSSGTGAYLDPDSDDDGISDAYEIRESLTPLVNDADQDRDRDGLTNLQEFWAGTAAGNSNSVFQITGVTRPVRGGVELEFSFDSVPGRTYRFAASTTVDGPPSPAGVVTASNEVTTVTLTLSGPQAFVRAIVQPIAD